MKQTDSKSSTWMKFNADRNKPLCNEKHISSSMAVCTGCAHYHNIRSDYSDLNMYCHNCMALNIYRRTKTQYNVPGKQPPCKLESHGTREQHSEAYILEDKVLACHFTNGYIKLLTRMAVGRPNVTAIYWYGHWLYTVPTVQCIQCVASVSFTY